MCRHIDGRVATLHDHVMRQGRCGASDLDVLVANCLIFDRRRSKTRGNVRASRGILQFLASVLYRFDVAAFRIYSEDQRVRCACINGYGVAALGGTES
jgi:hypothetical protein